MPSLHTPMKAQTGAKAVLAGVALAIVLATGALGGATQDGGGAGLDEQLVAALIDLARAYDEKKDPEAAHFFAACAIGLGSLDEYPKGLKKTWENEVYYGRSRGGKALVDTAPIEKKLASFAKEYKSVVDSLVKSGKGISDDARAKLDRAVVRYELARGAHDYIQATQRFNELRRQMKLRAILWDFDMSSRFILAAWYMGETGDYLRDAKSDETSVWYSADVAFGKEEANKSPWGEYGLRDHADSLRPFAILREDLLNPDARQLALGRWQGGKAIKTMILYRIPRTEYRKDIATPTRRAAGQTVAEDRDLWKDVEETVKVGDKHVIVACYPYADEPDAPRVLGDGKRTELGWADPNVKDLNKCGTPIMLRLFIKGAPTDVQAELRKIKGSSVGSRLYLNRDERVDLDDEATVVLLPEKPLEKGASYTVSMKFKLEGVPIEKNWIFTTREK